MDKSKVLKAAVLITMITLGVFTANSKFNVAEATVILPVADNGRPLKSDGAGHYCCENSGTDCGAACCN